MTKSVSASSLVVPIYLFAVALLAAFAWQVGYRQALDQLAQRGTSDLALASDSWTSQLQAYRELAVLMSDYPSLKALGPGSDRDAARAVLLDVSDKTGALDIFVTDRQGNIIVAAQDFDEGEPTYSRAGEPEFERAMHGALGTHHGWRSSDGRRVWYFAAPIFQADGRVHGVVVVVADIETLEWLWRGGASPVYLLDEGGDVFISNRSELLGWRKSDANLGLVPSEGPPSELRVSMIGRHEIWQLDWGPYVPKRSLHLVEDLPVIDMQANMLVDTGSARRLALAQAAAVAGICLALGMMLYLAQERRRTLALANAKLETRVAARTRELSRANDRLRREVAEREEAEAALKRAQSDLVQAGKLSALGQMSAGISHELNQPLMAIRQFADNGAAFLDRDKPDRARENLGRIAEMAARAARIIKNLRAFARNESEKTGKVDLVQVIESAIELTEPRLRQDGVTLEWIPPPAPVYAHGGEVRLGQVFVNLINNAADAMLEQEQRIIQIALHPGMPLSVSVRDFGPGIADPDKIFEPFYTTKEVGTKEGMGLGLSISYGLVQSFGGNIRGANLADGAIFTVQLESWSEERAA